MKKKFLYFMLSLILILGARNAMCGENESGAVLRLSENYTAAFPSFLPRKAISPWLIEALEHPGFEAIEWQVHLKRAPGEEPGVVQDIPSADFTVVFPTSQPITLYWSKGSHAETSDFEPRESVLANETPIVLSSFGGRSSDGVMPYFNLSDGKGGLILAIGWTGDWKASFTLTSPGQIHITAGLDAERLALPEDVLLRLPSLLAMSYDGSRMDGQNKFRRLMLARYTPLNHPPMTLMPVAASVHGMIGFNDTTEENLCQLAADIATTRLPIDTFWLDAGWNEGGFAWGQGNRHPDPTRFPRGLAPVGAAAARNGMRFLVWFEPERAMPGTWLVREHPEWLFVPRNTPPELRYQEKDGFRLLNLGNPDALNWALDTVSETILSANISIYRQDFNLYPAWFWNTDEAEEQQALNQVRHINGLYRFLDALVERFPELIIDNCASGGRRLDFEMMRRTVAYWHSDSCWDSKDYPRNVQAMAHGVSLWLPLHGLGAAATDIPALRSGMGACASYAIKFRDPAEVEALRSHLDKYLPIRPLYVADYYPLTPWTADPGQWLAFQFNDPEKRAGIIQAFCANTRGRETVTLRLHGLERDAVYELHSWDNDEPINMTGAELMDSGLPLRAVRENEALVVEYTAR
ncbi:MAG: hypothetical protein GXY07_11325 [Candidatus Hydrogenedentes bacterium]|nr:hypothetical protein [Candidatus Hydrogenedentota bacterium]